MTDLIKKLNIPNGKLLYSPMCGCVRIDKIEESIIYATTVNDDKKVTFTTDGKFTEYHCSERILFPSAVSNDWNNWMEWLFHKGDIIVGECMSMSYRATLVGVVTDYPYYVDCCNVKFNIEDDKNIEWRFANDKEKSNFLMELFIHDYQLVDGEVVSSVGLFSGDIILHKPTGTYLRIDGAKGVDYSQNCYISGRNLKNEVDVFRVDECYKPPCQNSLKNWFIEELSKRIKAEQRTFYVARDKNESLYLYDSYPCRRDYDFRTIHGSMSISKNLFPDLKWEDNPIEVELKIKQR